MTEKLANLSTEIHHNLQSNSVAFAMATNTQDEQNRALLLPSTPFLGLAHCRTPGCSLSYKSRAAQPSGTRSRYEQRNERQSVFGWIFCTSFAPRRGLIWVFASLTSWDYHGTNLFSSLSLVLWWVYFESNRFIYPETVIILTRKPFEKTQSLSKYAFCSQRVFKSYHKMAVLNT